MAAALRTRNIMSVERCLIKSNIDGVAVAVPKTATQLLSNYTVGESKSRVEGQRERHASTTCPWVGASERASECATYFGGLDAMFFVLVIGGQ